MSRKTDQATLVDEARGVRHRRGTRVRLQAPRGLLGLNLPELWRFRELMVFLAWRDIAVRYRQTLVGAAWAVIQPVLMTIVFGVCLGRLAGLPSGDIPYSLFVFAGLLPWTFFAACIGNAGNSVVGSEKLITKIYFPRLLIPLASMGAPLIDLLIAFCVLLGLMLWYGVGLSAQVLLLPVVVAMIALAAFGIGTLLAALNVSYRDFRYVLPFLIQLWLFATPTVYLQRDPEAISSAATGYPAWVVWLSDLNPLSALVASFRSCILGAPLDGMRLLTAGATALLAAAAGVLYFRYVEHRFADII